MKRRLLASLLALALLLGLTACGKGGDEEERPNAEPLNTVETVEGWIPSRIEFPDWLSRITGWSTEGDTIWFSGVTPEKSLVIAAYDTLAGEWNRVDFSTADAWQPEMNSVSLAGHSVWALLKESNRYEDYQKGTGRNEDELGYYVLHIDLTNGESTAVRIPFEGEGSTEGSGLFFTGLLGLDDDRALLSAMDKLYLIDAGVNVLSEPDLPIGGQFLHFRVDDTLYFWTQDGYAPFDPETLSFGAPIKLDMGIYTNNSTDSNAGHILYSDGKQLCRRNEATGAGEPLFAWLDVALSLSEKGGYEGFENSLGDFYYPGGDPMKRETEYFSIYSDISMRTIASSVPKSASASALESSVLPTPVGPRNRNDPTGLPGSLSPVRPRLTALAIELTASSCPTIRLCRIFSRLFRRVASDCVIMLTGMPVH